MRAVQITRFGGPEVLEVVDLPAPVPSPGQILLDVSAAGVNYADTHQVEDTYLAPQRLPMVPGFEVAGRVVAGTGHAEGTRVVALTAGQGGYAERAVADPASAFVLPDEIGDDAALALLAAGTTAWHLLRTCAALSLGESVVVHAAAGGVGSLAVQLARQWGAGRIIATASTAEKRRTALSLGADAAVDLSAATDARAVRDLLREANGGSPVDVVLEMTGGHVADGSLAALAPGGRLVTYGMASRVPPAPVDTRRLMATGTSVIGFWLPLVLRRPGGLSQAMEELLSLVRAGRLRPLVGGVYPLDGAAAAHRDLRARSTTGKLVLAVGD